MQAPHTVDEEVLHHPIYRIFILIYIYIPNHYKIFWSISMQRFRHPSSDAGFRVVLSWDFGFQTSGFLPVCMPKKENCSH